MATLVDKNLSIIIPHLHGFNILDECITSIIQYTNDVNYEIIVINNNSIDGSIEKIKKKFSDLTIIDSNTNRGYAGGCNLGAKNAMGKYLLFLNNDTIITENAIEILLNEIQINNNISSVQPKIKNYHNKEVFEYAGGSGGYIDYLAYPFARGRIFNTIEKDEGQYEDKKKIFWASGTAFLTRKEIFNKIGGFDETLFAHMEEIDYHWKCLLHKYDIYVIPKSIIYHKGGETLQYGTHKKIYLNHRNSMVLFLTNHIKLSFNMIMKRLILEKLAALYYLLTGKIGGFIAVLKALIWILLNRKYIKMRRAEIKKTVPHDSNIPEQLMVPYSIVKKYYNQNKKTFQELNQ